MCLYPKTIKNRKYLPNKKNGYNPPKCPHPSLEYVQIDCGNCGPCRKKEGNFWRIRLQEQHRTDNTGKFATNTFSEEWYYKLAEDVQTERIKKLKKLAEIEGKKPKIEPLKGYELENAIATLAKRRFRDRWRKKYGKSLKCWFITELGQEKTERIHMHGIAYTNVSLNEFRIMWKYGNVNARDKTWEQSYCNETTISYLIKYVTVPDKIHPTYKPIILCSPGIGSGYIKRQGESFNKFKGKDTKQYYPTRQGFKVALTPYYRRKLFTDEQREFMSIEYAEMKIVWLAGMKIDISNGYEDYEAVRDYQRQINRMLGYGGPITEEQRIKDSNKRDIRRQKRYEQIEKDKINKLKNEKKIVGKTESVPGKIAS